ncbi:hypothetical protein EDC01DRAFT_77953 [Geopyxis carbonaria]|nr:hypothetical protein EDC01DRAFT_77953 [Geopyxis carbonaria]
MSMNIPLLAGATLGFIGSLGHLLGGAHIPRNPLLSELDPLDAAYIRIAWNIVGILMLALSSIELHLALKTTTSGVVERQTIIRICALAWVMNGLCFMHGVGIKETPTWICVINAVLVGIGSQNS